MPLFFNTSAAEQRIRLPRYYIEHLLRDIRLLDFREVAPLPRCASFASDFWE
jgi:hypothetical protein